MSDLLSGLLAALISTNTPVAVSNLVQERTGVSMPVVDPNDPTEKAYVQLVEDDDQAQADIAKWADDARAAVAAGNTNAPIGLSGRIRIRLDGVKKEYDDFLRSHPNHVRAHLAYGSFLHETGDFDGARANFEKATELDPADPAGWNNLGNLYEHDDIKKSMKCFAKAIELDPAQSVYYENLAVCVFMFRTDARELYGISETEVFDKALGLYRQAMKLDPENFVLASDYAECFYGITPQRYKDGIEAWKHCLQIAPSEREKQGVYLHLARLSLKLENFVEAERNLGLVTNASYLVLKGRIQRNLEEAVRHSLTNSTPAR